MLCPIQLLQSSEWNYHSNPAHSVCSGDTGSPGSPGVRGATGRVGFTGATGATFLQVQATKRRVVRQAGCPGKLQ